METEMGLLGVVVWCFFTWSFIQLLARRAKPSGLPKLRLPLPPGPTPIPIVGNLFKLGNEPHKSLAELARIHGPIMTIKLGQLTTVVMSSPALAQQVLQKQDLSFSNRFVPDAVRALNYCQFSVVFLPVSPLWRNCRKILTSHMLSTHKLDAQQRLRFQKVEQLIGYVHVCCEKGIAVDIGKAAFTTALNVISSTIFSADLADPSLESGREFKDLVWGVLEEIGRPNLGDYWPAVLRKLDPQRVRHRSGNYFRKMLEIFDPIVEQRLELRASHSYIARNDLLDAFLDTIQAHPEELDISQTKRLIVDIFIAGTETSSSTVEWAMTEMLRNPKTLSKVKAELQQVVWQGKAVEESNIPRLPYLQAVVKETLRLHPPLPFLIARTVDTDIEVCGFTVPKGAKVLVNVWAIGRNSSFWSDPESFIPERFLGLKVDVGGQDFEFIPFGSGRRICPGLSLGMRMVHLMLGSLLNSFRWKLQDSVAHKDINMDEKSGLTLQKAQPLHVVPIPL